MTTINYINGNCSVTLLEDGTKIREWEGEAKPFLPESIDCKITDWCDAGCSWCHESSTRRGKHASLDAIFRILGGGQAGMEVALGGGDTLSHPQIREIIAWIIERGMVPNVTVNGRHVARHADLISELRKLGLKGLGVSWHQESEQDILAVSDSDTVLHFIVGVDKFSDALRLACAEKRKFLLLGYKTWGRGVNVRKTDVNRTIGYWRFWLPRLLKSGSIVSFDNLGIEQMGIKNLLSSEHWDERYMGDDGTFTMYVDAVIEAYAPTSTCVRQPIAGADLQEIFYDVRNLHA